MVHTAPVIASGLHELSGSPVVMTVCIGAILPGFYSLTLYQASFRLVRADIADTLVATTGLYEVVLDPSLYRSFSICAG
jgi:hypothetical protein